MDAPHWQDFWPLYLTDCSRCWTPRHDSSMDDENTTTWRHCFVSCTGCECQNASPCGWPHLRIAVNTTWRHTISPSSYIGRVASPLVNDCAQHQYQNSSFRVHHARESAIVHFAWLRLGRGIPWHHPCSLLNHLQFFDVVWRLNCSRAPSQINYISERSMLRDSVYFITLKLLDYNVIMTFRFNNNNYLIISGCVCFSSC